MVGKEKREGGNSKGKAGRGRRGKRKERIKGGRREREKEDTIRIGFKSKIRGRRGGRGKNERVRINGEMFPKVFDVEREREEQGHDGLPNGKDRGRRRKGGNLLLGVSEEKIENREDEYNILYPS